MNTLFVKRNEQLIHDFVLMCPPRGGGPNIDLVLYCYWSPKYVYFFLVSKFTAIMKLFEAQFEEPGLYLISFHQERHKKKNRLIVCSLAKTVFPLV